MAKYPKEPNIDLDTDQATDKMPKRFPIRLPSWHERRLLWWAHAKGVSKTALSQNTLQARIEANETHIEAMMADLAAERGISVADLKAEVLDKAGYVPDDDPDDS
jgi:hypothetical protein